jgi:low temperature requirement protein LtrA
VVEDRSVSFLELFYDLVFVVLIAQIAHTLAGNATWTGLRDFVVVFGLVWIAWINGTLYHDLHGGEDGRSRTYIFVQMSLLVLLAVFAGHAADDPADARGFAIVYALLLLFIAWQWFDVRRFDTPEWRGVAGRYVQGTVLIAAIMLLRRRFLGPSPVVGYRRRADADRQPRHDPDAARRGHGSGHGPDRIPR